jgi:AAA family ATP:ADP antiporter
MVGAGIAALWSMVGIYLGRWFERDDSSSPHKEEPTVTLTQKISNHGEAEN